MKIVKSILIWFFITAYLIVIFGFINKENDLEICKSIDISIVDASDNYFIEEDEVLTRLQNKGVYIIGEQLINIDRDELENQIGHHPTIKNVEIYYDHFGTLSIDLTQRNPIVRVINENRESYYIDEEGYLMPLSDNFTAHVLIANGNINEAYNSNNKHKLMLDNDSIKNSSKLLREIYTLANFIVSDEFWDAQIEQIYFNQKGEIEIIPRVGTHIIILGSIENYQNKFTKLKAVYENGFKKNGWNNYRIINLKYKNQVICTKK